MDPARKQLDGSHRWILSLTPGGDAALSSDSFPEALRTLTRVSASRVQPAAHSVVRDAGP